MRASGKSAHSVLVAALSIAVLAAVGTGVAVAASARHSTVAAPKLEQVYATYYGWYDNTPPGCATAYSGCAHGNGTYTDPITFASDKVEYPVGTIIYYPTLEKYLKMGDDCQECDLDWSGKGPDGGPGYRHLDIWIGGQGGNEFDVINCEDGLTQGMPNGKPIQTPFIINPPRGLPVSGEQVFDAHNNHCFGGAATTTSHGRYANGSTSQCLDDPSGSSTSGTPASAAACSTTASEDLAFDGAFFTVDKLCLQTDGGKAGSRIVWATCNGNPREQWSINPNGTITWIQYTMCVEQTGSKIELAKCTSSSAERWKFTSENA